MHENEGFRHVPSEENFIRVLESLRKRLKVRERGFGGERTWIDREKSREMRSELRAPLIYHLSNSQQIKRCRGSVKL